MNEVLNLFIFDFRRENSETFNMEKNEAPRS